MQKRRPGGGGRMEEFMSSTVGIDEIIEKAEVETWFQPVIDLSAGKIVGYEALSRGPRDSAFYMPQAMIAEAKSRGRIGELDAVMRKKAVVTAVESGMHDLLFINVDPIAVCADEGDWGETVVSHSSDFGLPPRQVVLEVTENSALCGLDRFYEMLLRYRSAGYSIAFDGISTPPQQISIIAEVAPQFVKVSGRFVRQIGPETAQKISSILTVARAVGSKIVAVGVETPEELRALREAGVELVQGNLFGRPSSKPEELSEEALRLLQAAPLPEEPQEQEPQPAEPQPAEPQPENPQPEEPQPKEPQTQEPQPE